MEPGLARQSDVVGVAAAATQKPPILGPRYCPTDSHLAHALSPVLRSSPRDRAWRAPRCPGSALDLLQCDVHKKRAPPKRGQGSGRKVLLFRSAVIVVLVVTVGLRAVVVEARIGVTLAPFLAALSPIVFAPFALVPPAIAPIIVVVGFGRCDTGEADDRDRRSGQRHAPEGAPSSLGGSPIGVFHG